MTGLPKESYDLILARDAALRRAERAERINEIGRAAYRELETLYQASQEQAMRAEGDRERLNKIIGAQREELDHVYHALNDPYPALHRELEAARAYLAYVLDTYPPTSAIETTLRATWEKAKELSE